jgi:hypothetical protein
MRTCRRLIRKFAWVAVLLFLCPGVAGARERVQLTGKWERWIRDRLHDKVEVPSSYHPIGVVRLRRQVDVPSVPLRSRAILRFEGIAHQATVRVNSDVVGHMGPWTPYEFDISQNLRPGANWVEVEVSDWQVPLGPIGAWEAYGGIIRDVFLEFRPDPYIENAYLRYTFTPSMDAAQNTLQVFVKSSTSARGKLTAELLQGASRSSSVSQDVSVEGGTTTLELSWNTNSPVFWSPEVPNLYQLRVTLDSPGGQDTFSAVTGYRKLEIRGNQFYLNGQRLILRGVCRHDIWKDQGHTLTLAQIEQDMQMIKAMGANFVRLVHYPHDRRVVEIADRIGLLVTEESGLVWVDFRKLTRETLETGLGNLERTAKRDWNSPSLFALLLSNESAPTVDVIREAKQRIKQIAPHLLVSAARIDSAEKSFAGSKTVFDEGGLDFYTYHPYTYDMDVFEQAADGLSGKPLVFSEWGGRAVGQSPVIMKETMDEIGKLVAEGRLAGHCFWSWADLPEFSRGGSEMEGGILKSGVVTESRMPRPEVYVALAELFRRLPGPGSEMARAPKLIQSQVAPISASSRFVPISIQAIVDSSEQKQAWVELKSLMERFWKTHAFTRRHWEQTGRHFWLWSAPDVRVGVVPFSPPARDGFSQPLVVTPGHPRVEFPIDMTASRLHFLGNVTLPDGYPMIGKLGDVVGRYLIVYSDGSQQEVPLRWGQEIARSNMISVASRIDPATAEGERVLIYEKDATREVYQARLLSVAARNQKIRRIVCELTPPNISGQAPPPDTHHAIAPPLGANEQVLVLFAVTAEISETSPK